MQKKVSFSLSRLYKYIITSGHDFAIISPFRGEFSFKENLDRAASLVKDIRALKLGFIRVKGGYIENQEGVENEVIEMSYVIPQISFNDAIKLGRKYQQETILYKHDQAIGYFDCKTGKSELRFKSDITTDEKAVKQYFTQFKNKGKRKFKFLNEETNPSLPNAYLNKLGEYTSLT